jgi:hypothetical protein
MRRSLQSSYQVFIIIKSNPYMNITITHWIALIKSISSINSVNTIRRRIKYGNKQLIFERLKNDCCLLLIFACLVVWLPSSVWFCTKSSIYFEQRYPWWYSSYIVTKSMSLYVTMKNLTDLVIHKLREQYIE